MAVDCRFYFVFIVLLFHMPAMFPNLFLMSGKKGFDQQMSFLFGFRGNLCEDSVFRIIKHGKRILLGTPAVIFHCVPTVHISFKFKSD